MWWKETPLGEKIECIKRSFPEHVCFQKIRRWVIYDASLSKTHTYNTAILDLESGRCVSLNADFEDVCEQVHKHPEQDARLSIELFA